MLGLQKETAPNSRNRRLLKSVIPSEAEEWSESGGRDMDGQTDRSSGSERVNLKFKSVNRERRRVRDHAITIKKLGGEGFEPPTLSV